MKRLIGVLVLFLLINTVTAFNSSWGNHIDVNVTGGDSALKDYDLWFKVDKQNSMESDYKDVIPVNGTCMEGNTGILKYHIQWYNITESHLHVRVPNFNTGINNFCFYFNNTDGIDYQDEYNTYDVNYSLLHHLSDTSGNITDSSKYNITGIVWGNVTYNQNGVIGKGICVKDGVVYTGYDYQGLHESTTEGWFKSGNAISGHLYNAFNTGTDGSLVVTDNTNNGVRFIITLDITKTIHTYPTISTSQWEYIGTVYDGGDIKYYRNGVLVNSTSTTGSINPSTCKLTYGGRNCTGTFNAGWDGCIDEFAVSDKTRSPDYFKRRYQNTNDSLTVYGGVKELTTTSTTTSTTIGTTSTTTSTTSTITTGIREVGEFIEETPSLFVYLPNLIAYFGMALIVIVLVLFIKDMIDSIGDRVKKVV